MGRRGGGGRGRRGGKARKAGKGRKGHAHAPTGLHAGIHSNPMGGPIKGSSPDEPTKKKGCAIM